MKTQIKHTRISTREDGSEIVDHSYDDYSAGIYIGYLSKLPNYAAHSHWHDDLEFTLVLSGHMLYNVNGTIVRLEPGTGILVNSRCFHHGFSIDRTECVYLCVLLHPILLCGTQALERDYISPFTSQKAPSHILLRPDISWEAEVMDLVQSIYEHQDDTSAPLWIQSCFYRIWHILYQNVFYDEQQSQNASVKEQKLLLLKSMISYIKDNYQEKITLDDIAKVGCLSKSGCLSLFKRYIKESPINYLISYRLQVGAELLTTTNSSVTEIAYQVGFSSTSYFSAYFHKQYDCSPQEYRRLHTHPSVDENPVT